MNIKFLIYICLLICSSGLINGLFFILDPLEQRCISKDMLEKSFFSGVYYISGEHEEGNKAFIKDSNNHIVWRSTSQKHATFNVDIKQPGVYSLCIEETANVHMTVSFELYDEKRDEQIISVQNIENLNTVIHSIRRKLDVIHSNMRNSAVRRGTHLEVSNSINTKISFYTAIKILFLIIFSIFQILMLTSIFSNVKVVSKISVQEQKSYSNINTNEPGADVIL